MLQQQASVPHTFLQAVQLLTADEHLEQVAAAIIRATFSATLLSRVMLLLPDEKGWRAEACGERSGAQLEFADTSGPTDPALLTLADQAAQYNEIVWAAAGAAPALLAPGRQELPAEWMRLALPLPCSKTLEGMICIEREVVAPGDAPLTPDLLRLLGTTAALALANTRHRRMLKSLTDERFNPGEQLPLIEALFTHAPIGIQVFGPDGASLMMNEAQRRLLGLPTITSGVGEFNILTDPFILASGIAAAFRRAYAGEMVYLANQYVDLSDSGAWQAAAKTIRYNQYLVPIHDANGAVVMVVSYAEDITERRVTERELTRATRLIEGFFAHAPMAFQIYDRDGVSLRMNEANRRLLGLPDVNYGIGTFNALTDPLMVTQGHTDFYVRAYAGEIVQVPEFSADFADPLNQWPTDRKTLHFSQVLFPMHADDGSVEAVVSCVQDITARKTSEDMVRQLNTRLEERVAERTAALEALVARLEAEEQALQRSQTNLRALVRNFPTGVIALFDADLRYLVVGGADFTAINVDPASWEGRTIWECLPAQVVTVVEPLYRAALKADGPLESEYPYGELIYRTITAPVHDEYGNPIAGLMIMLDITARKQSEQALRTSEQKYRLLFENSMDAILIADDEGYYLQANDAACRLLGYPREQVLQMNVAELGTAQYSDTRQHYSRYAEHGYEIGEFVLRRSDGSTRIAEYVACRIAPGLHQSILRDVTERQQNETRLREQARALATLREHERLARELHDNLAQVLAYANTQVHAARDFLAGGRVPMATACLTSLLSVVQMAQQDIQEHLFGTRAQQELVTAGADATGFIPALQEQIQRLKLMYGLHIHLQAPAGLSLNGLLPLARLHLLRIVQEALTNVRKHAQITEAHINVEQVGDSLVVTVRDAGRGFDLKAGQSHTTASGRIHGFGLEGMRSRAAEIGGQLTIISKPGSGTEVQIVLPANLSTGEQNEGLRVLLVDDSAVYLDGLQEVLHRYGFSVVGIAHDGETALEQARLLRPDLVLMDIDLPGMSGLEATSAILAEQSAARVVILTVAEDERTLFEALLHGAQGYLSKSLDAAVLGAQLTGLLRGEVALSPRLAHRVLRELAEREDQMPTALLTSQQIRVLTLLAQGLTYKEIGQSLGYSERAIKYHTGDAIKQLQARDRATAIAYVRRLIQRGAWPADEE